MAEQESGHYLEVDLKPYPNPALTQILLGEGMHKVIAEYTLKVATVFTTAIQGRPHRGDQHAGLMVENTYATVQPGGFKNDRVVGEVGSHVDYMAADEFGRHTNNPYEGHRSLQNALYSVLPYAP